MSDNKVSIDPMAALHEARVLNDFYSNRCLILSNEIVQLSSAEKQHTEDTEKISAQYREMLSERDIEINQLKQDLAKARGEVVMLTNKTAQQQRRRNSKRKAVTNG
ncbi:hypothetical protein [Pseudochrobactrum saccharolyticum]|uniref:hypothetical protein n=1 Tax=Pseudochrobactrum saccharolyticum TaxID=354352 RepID=UPI002776BE63|nr:hypothetical protein [Pseudochrobactrum saccharolyticum]MDP8249631.1 hypothetical protein [Pseudochrobactrum saccharolyticum]